MTPIQLKHNLRLSSLSGLLLAALVVSSAYAGWTELGASGKFRLMREDIPQKGRDKCIVFKVVDANDKPYWATCDWQRPEAFPWPIWSGGIIQEPDSERLLVIISRSVSFATGLSVYEVDPRKPQAVAASYDDKGKLKNPHELYSLARKPIASFMKDFASLDMECSMNRKITGIEIIGGSARVTTQGEHLKAKSSTPCSPMLFDYDLKSKKWKGPQEAQK